MSQKKEIQQIPLHCSPQWKEQYGKFYWLELTKSMIKVLLKKIDRPNPKVKKQSSIKYHLMLREHFLSVPPLIESSCKLYYKILLFIFQVLVILKVWISILDFYYNVDFLQNNAFGSTLLSLLILISFSYVILQLLLNL